MRNYFNILSTNILNNILKEKLNILYSYKSITSLILIFDSFKYKIRDGYKNNTG